MASRNPQPKSGRPQPKPDSGEAGVLVFIDGWNLHRGCERAFGHGQVHPLLLGQHLAGKRKLNAVHYYIGVPDSRAEAENSRRRTRQLEFMAKTGVNVHPKKLHYRHEWKFNKWDLPDPRRHEGETMTTEVTSRRQGREKGVDVELALSAFQAAIEARASTIVIVSADTDLDLIPTAIAEIDPPVAARVENAVVNTSKDKYINHAYAWSHQLNKKVFSKVRDDTDYDKPMSKRSRDKLLARLRSGLST